MNFYIFSDKMNFIPNLKIIKVIHGPFKIKRSSTIVILKRIQTIHEQDKISNLIPCRKKFVWSRNF